MLAVTPSFLFDRYLFRLSQDTHPSMNNKRKKKEEMVSLITVAAASTVGSGGTAVEE